MTFYSKLPQDDKKYSWTRHSLEKLRQYALSPQRIKRVIRNPRRIEKGIAPETIAVMQPLGKGTLKKKWSQEIWVMYQTKVKNQKSKIKNIGSGQIKIISVWRYPGVSPERGILPIPPDILEEIQEYLN